MEADDTLLATDIISYIKSNIEEDNLSDLQEVLALIDFEQISYNDAIQLTILLLKNTQLANNKNAANLIYQQHDKFYPSNAPIQFMTILFLEPRCDVVLLGFLVNIVKLDFNFIDIVYELIQVKTGYQDNYNSSQLSIAFDRCCRVFGIPSFDTLNKLYNLAKNVNDTLANELRFQIRKINNYADIPTWILGTSEPDDLISVLPKESSVIIPELSTYLLEDILVPSKDWIEEMIEKIDDEIEINADCDTPLKKKDIRNILLANYNALSLPQKYDLAKEFVQTHNVAAMGDDITLFITLGPSNPIVGSTLSELDYGDTRMFLFNNFENNEEDFDMQNEDFDNLGYPLVKKDWFRGYCIQCNLRIRRRWHAVRKPGKYGGWFGCFCSWDCIKNNIIDVDAADKILLNVCDIYENEMDRYGILDRIPDEEYSQYIADKLNSNKQLTSSNNIDLPISTSLSENQEALAVINQVQMNQREPIITLYYYYSEQEELTIKFLNQLEQFVEYTPFNDGTIGSPVNIIKVDVDSPEFDEPIHQSHNIEAIPTTVVYYLGIPKSTFKGNQIRPIVDLIQKFGL